MARASRPQRLQLAEGERRRLARAHSPVSVDGQAVVPSPRHSGSRRFAARRWASRPGGPRVSWYFGVPAADAARRQAERGRAAAAAISTPPHCSTAPPQQAAGRENDAGRRRPPAPSSPGRAPPRFSSYSSAIRKSWRFVAAVAPSFPRPPRRARARSAPARRSASRWTAPSAIAAVISSVRPSRTSSATRALATITSTAATRPPPIRGSRRWLITPRRTLERMLRACACLTPAEELDKSGRSSRPRRRVQRREHEVARVGDLQGDPGRLGVAELADQDESGSWRTRAGAPRGTSTACRSRPPAG